MLSNQLKIVFVHIPKAAGQSIEKCFLDYHGISWQDRAALLLRENQNPEQGPPRLAHLTASEYVFHGYLGQQEFEDYFKFSFVRNPWARLVSEYKWRGYYRKWRFKDWLNDAFPEPGWTDHWRHVMPQYDYLFDSNGNCLVDYIGHVENFNDDFNEVREQVGVKLPDVPHANKSIKSKKAGTFDSLQFIKQFCKEFRSKEKLHKSYLSYYDRQTWEWVSKRYKKDIITFNYTDQLNVF